MANIAKGVPVAQYRESRLTKVWHEAYPGGNLPILFQVLQACFSPSPRSTRLFAEAALRHAQYPHAAPRT